MLFIQSDASSPVFSSLFTHPVIVSFGFAEFSLQLLNGIFQISDLGLKRCPCTGELNNKMKSEIARIKQQEGQGQGQGQEREREQEQEQEREQE